MRVEYLISRAPGLGSLSGHVLLALGQKGLWIRKARPRFLLRFHETTVRRGEGGGGGNYTTLRRIFHGASLLSERYNNDRASCSKSSGNFSNCQDKRWRYFLDLLCLHDKRYTIFSNFDIENLLHFSRYFIIPSLFSNRLSFRGKVAIISLKLLPPPFPGSDWTLSSNFPKTFTELR